MGMRTPLLILGYDLLASGILNSISEAEGCIDSMLFFTSSLFPVSYHSQGT